MMESDMNALLRADAGVSAIVGSGSAARVYPLILPQAGALPAVTYQRISTPRIVTATLGGQNARIKCRMQLDCWAETFAQAKALAAAVRSAMLGAATFTAIALDERDMYEAGESSDGLTLYRTSADFSCWYLE